MRKTLAILIAIISCVICSAQAQKVDFAWGAGLSSSVDMGGNNMSNIGMEAYAGIKVPGVDILGVGAGMFVPINNSQRSLPFYLIGRTNFSTRPSLCFLDVRCGLSVNYLDNDSNQTGEYVSIGVGMVLASTNKFKSHLILAYTHVGRDSYYIDDTLIDPRSLQLITLRLGITF